MRESISTVAMAQTCSHSAVQFLLNEILTGGLKVMAMYWLTLTAREKTDHIKDLKSATSGLYRHSLMVR